MKLDILVEGETTTIRESSGSPNEIMAMACCVVDDVADLLSQESDCHSSKSELLRMIATAIIMMDEARNPHKNAAADCAEALEVRL